MDVKLVVTTGKNAGMVVPIKRSKFYIGRSPECHLRSGNAAVARHHCAILLGENVAAVRDFGSSTGTMLNGEKVDGQRKLRNGDQLEVGPLKFEVHLSHGAVAKPAGAAAKPKEPTPQQAQQSAPARQSTAAKAPAQPSAAGDDDFDVTALWAGMAAPAPKPKIDLSELQSHRGAAVQDEQSDDEDNGPVDVDEKVKEEMRRKRDIVGVSKATQARRTTETTQEAAEQLLKKLFR